MPYGISESQEDCSTWATVKQEADGSFTTIGCHESKQDAIDQMVVVSLSEEVDPLGQVDSREARADTFTATKEMKEEAQRGLDWRAEFGRGGTAIGAGRATDIVKGNPMSIDTVKRMVRYFQRHEADKDAEGFSPGEDGFPSNGRIAWALWGGDPGYRWAEAITDRLGVWDRDLGEDEEEPLNIFGEPVVEEEPIEEEEMNLNPRQMALYELTEAIAEEFGMFNQGIGADGSHYVAESPFKDEGLICANCVFYEAGRMCEVVEGDIAPEGICKLWIIGEDLLESKAIPLEEEPEEEPGEYEARSNDVSSWNEVIKMTDTMQWIPKLVDESRSIAYSTMEVRAIGEGNSLVGYAAVFDSPSEPLPWIEYVRKGAFAKTLKDGADVRLLIDHEGVPLARSKSGTLTMEEDERGLKVQADLDPTNPDAARIISAMRRGDISQMSFAFRTVKDSWSADRSTRELKEVQLFDVSVVTFPAYEATVAELRSKNSSVSVAPSGSLRLRSAQIEIARRK
jgi:HK97 family phage prohead protease